MGRGSSDTSSATGSLRSSSSGLSEAEQRTLATYETAAAQWGDARSAPEFWTPELEHFQRWAGSGKVLDVGSGNGRDAILLNSHGYQVTGVDISPALLDIAAKNCPEAEFVTGSVYELPFDNECFEATWSAASLLHLPKRKLPQALGELHRVLKPGGLNFITVKAGDGEEMLTGEFGERFFSFYQVEELQSKVEDAGFEVLRTHQREAGGADWICLYARKPNQMQLI